MHTDSEHESQQTRRAITARLICPYSDQTNRFTTQSKESDAMTHRSLVRTAALAAILAAPLAALVSTATAAEAEELARQVTIRRPAYGVPHIQADALHPVAFGFADAP